MSFKPPFSLLFSLVLVVLVGCGSTTQPAISPTIAVTEADAAPPNPKRDPAVPEVITFKDLDLPIEPDSEFASWMLTQRVHDLTGTLVTVRGYINPGLFQLRNVKEFVLMRDTECCVFGPGGAADHLIQVRLAGKTGIDYTRGPVEVTGKLSVAPFTGSDGHTWSVFQIDATDCREVDELPPVDQRK